MGEMSLLEKKLGENDNFLLRSLCKQVMQVLKIEAPILPLFYSMVITVAEIKGSVFVAYVDFNSRIRRKILQQLKIVGVKSCLPYGELWPRFYYRNRKAISLLERRRLEELERYILEKTIDENLPFSGDVMKSISSIETDGGVYHFFAMFNVHNDIMRIAGESRVSLFSIFNKIEEGKEVGEIDLKRLMEVNDRFRNPAREP